jgi:hypothetical protein
MEQKGDKTSGPGVWSNSVPISGPYPQTVPYPHPNTNQMYILPPSYNVATSNQLETG